VKPALDAILAFGQPQGGGAGHGSKSQRGCTGHVHGAVAVANRSSSCSKNLIPCNNPRKVQMRLQVTRNQVTLEKQALQMRRTTSAKREIICTGELLMETARVRGSVLLSAIDTNATKAHRALSRIFAIHAGSPTIRPMYSVPVEHAHTKMLTQKRLRWNYLRRAANNHRCLSDLSLYYTRTSEPSSSMRRQN